MKHEGDDSPLFASQHCQHVPAAAGSLWHRQSSRGGGGTVAAAGPAATATPAALAEQGGVASITFESFSDFSHGYSYSAVYSTQLKGED